MLNNEVISAWQERQLPAVLASVNQAGEPNIIYVSSVSLYKNQCFLVADNYFCKTKENILAGCKTLSLLFINKDMQAYQVKAEYEYHTGSPDMPNSCSNPRPCLRERSNCAEAQLAWP